MMVNSGKVMIKSYILKHAEIKTAVSSVFRSATLVLCFWGAEIVYAQKPVKVYEPQQPFDVKQAADMLNTGTAQIKGSAFYDTRPPINILSKGDIIYARPGVVVTLYPVTPYLEEYFDLKKKDKPGKRIAAISREANSFRILTKVYTATGDFAFFGLKPGKYYIETTVHFPSGVGGYEVTKTVEITQEGEVVNVKLEPKRL